MFSFNQCENVNQLHAHNIRITELNPTSSRMSQSQPHVVHLPKVRMLSRGGRSGPGVRINNIKTIKPPDPEIVKKLEEEKLRAQNSKPAVIISVQRQVQAIQHYRLLDGAALERLHCEILGSLSIPSSAQIVVLEPFQPHLISAEGEESKDAHIWFSLLTRCSCCGGPQEARVELLNQIFDIKGCIVQLSTVEEEIVNRSQNCAHTSYDCSLPVLSGYQYCHRHILDDPAAPFRQCAHLYSNGERCPIPTPSEPRDLRDPGLCFEHARAVLCMRQRSAAPPPPVASTETLLNQLQHYVKPERPRTTSCASSVSVVSDPAEQEQVTTQAIDPFKQINATAVNAAYSASIMEYASCSDSDGDSVTLGPGGDCRAGGHEDLSDAEDAPSEELPLWRAGVYTVEEAVSEANNMLRLLQSAYLRQMDRMRVLLRTSRLQYLRKLKTEKEQYCSINSQARSGPLTARERRQLRKLKAFASYHRRHGVDAVLARKLHHKRAKMYDPCPNRPIPSQGRCTFTEGGVRCPQHVLPASKLCLKHILHDRHQVLFAPCGDMRGVTSCREPIPKLPLPSSACRYHTDPPVYTVFTLKKDESDSDSDSHSTSDPESPHTEVTEDVALNTDNSADDRQDIGEVMLPPDNAFE